MSLITGCCIRCGRPVVFAHEESVQACVACGTLNEPPKAKGAALEVLRRATEQRLRCDFHNAENSYQHVLLDSPDEHEALWGLALCRYGVEYVDDPKTGKRLPVVHGVRRKPMQLDSDFRQACSLAPERIRAQYEAEAEYIDNAMAKIRELAEACPPFDVFICHKTTRPGTDEYTEDYSRAFKLYHLLDKQGYRVFFAPTEMEGMAAGSDYEAGIYHALDTSKVMLVVCSREEYLTSPWVRNEWQRFLEMADEGADKRLLPLLYGELPPALLPRDFRVRKLQAVAMGEMGSAEQVLAAVRKAAGKPAAAPAPEPQPGQPEPERLICAPESHFRTKVRYGECWISEYRGPGGVVVVPPEIAGKKVTHIGDEAFKECAHVTEVILPDSIQWIGENAFSSCTALEKLRLSGELEEIGEYVFSDCAKLREMTIPKGVKHINGSAFMGCTSLTGIALDPENPHFTLRRNVLMDKFGTLVRFFPDRTQEHYTVPEGVRIIGDYAFDSCAHLQSVTLPDGLRSLSWCAFADCTGLTDMTLPDTVVELGYGAFINCTGLLFVKMPQQLMEIGESAFHNCAALIELTIPRSVESIESTAFDECPDLVLHVHEGSFGHTFAQREELFHLVIDGAQEAPAVQDAPDAQDAPAAQAKEPLPEPDSSFETSVAADGCIITKYTGKSEHVVIPNMIRGQKVVQLDPFLFQHDWRLCSLHLPEHLHAIGVWALYDCPRLTSITVDKANPKYISLDGVLFTRDGSLVQMPNGYQASSYRVPEGVKSIDFRSFERCLNLESITLPESLERIGFNAFGHCAALKSIEIPSGVKTIETFAFCDCTSLTSVRLNEGLQTLDSHAFDGCTSLVEINLPQSLRKIGNSVFHRCNKLPQEIRKRSWDSPLAGVAKWLRT